MVWGTAADGCTGGDEVTGDVDVAGAEGEDEALMEE